MEPVNHKDLNAVFLFSGSLFSQDAFFLSGNCSQMLYEFPLETCLKYLQMIESKVSGNYRTYIVYPFKRVF